MVGCWRKTADDWAIRDCAAVSYRQLDCEKNIGGGMENGRRRIYSIWLLEHLPQNENIFQYFASRCNLCNRTPRLCCSTHHQIHPPCPLFRSPPKLSVAVWSMFLLVFRWFFPFIFIKKTVRACVPQMSQIPNCGRQSVS